MRKKLLITLMTVCMTVLIAACGVEDSGDKKQSSQDIIAELETEEGKENPKDSETQVEEKKETQEPVKTEVQDSTIDEEYAKLPESKGFEFESNGDGTCTLKKIGTCKDRDIVIPTKSPEGDLVTEIAEYAFYDAENIDRIIIADKKIELGTKAFMSCEAEKIIITGCEVRIGESAFYSCSDINEVFISNCTLDVESYAFYDTGKNMIVQIVNCTGALEEKSLQSCDMEKLFISGCELELGDYVFAYCEDLAAVSMDNSTLDIGNYAFYDSCDDADIDFTDCNLEIEDKAFQSCGLLTLSIFGGSTVIGKNSFAYCEDLKDITIDGNKIDIGTYAFYDCSSLANVAIAANSTDDKLEITIDDKAFQSCSVESIVIGRGKVKIGDNAFAYCGDLADVEIKGTLTDIGDYAFYGCAEELIIRYNGREYDNKSIEDAK